MRISIIVPVKNRTKYISQAILSVLDSLDASPLRDWDYEILVGDNASSVPIKPILDELDDANIKYIRNESDLGIFGNMNALIAASKGRWIHCVHDDDWILRGFYAAFHEATLWESPEVVSVCARLVREDGSMAANEPWYDMPGQVEGKDLFRRLSFGNPLSICGMMVSRTAYRKAGLYREDLQHAADWDMWKRLSLRCAWHWRTETLARFRVHSGSATHRYQQTGYSATDIRKAIEAAKELCPMDCWEAFTNGSRHFARSLMNDAARFMSEDNPDLAKINAAEAVKILDLVG